jgi:hypothetical protein
MAPLDIAGLFSPQPTMRAWTDPRVPNGQHRPAMSAMPGSAGIFAEYMRQNMLKKTPTFMPPQLGGANGGGAAPGGGASQPGDGLPGEFGSGGGDYGDTNVGSAAVGSGSSLLGGLGWTAAEGGKYGFQLAGPIGGLLGYLGGLASERGRANDTTNPSSRNAINGLDAMSDAYSGLGAGGLFGGGSGADAAAAGAGGISGLGGGGLSAGDIGDAGFGDLGLGDLGDSGDGDGDGFAKGGMVTKKRLKGKNPKGPDDGYAALDVGEAVISKRMVKKHPRLIAGLLGK